MRGPIETGMDLPTKLTVYCEHTTSPAYVVPASLYRSVLTACTSVHTDSHGSHPFCGFEHSQPLIISNEPVLMYYKDRIVANFSKRRFLQVYIGKPSHYYNVGIICLYCLNYVMLQQPWESEIMRFRKLEIMRFCDPETLRCVSCVGGGPWTVDHGPWIHEALQCKNLRYCRIL